MLSGVRGILASKQRKNILASKPVLISYKELYDNRLCGGSSHGKDDQATLNERIAALEWLRDRIKANSES
jgi:hypothetical protein